MNGDAIDTQYEHLKDSEWQWLTDSFCNRLTRMIEIFALRHRHAQHVLAVSFYDRQEPD